MSAEVDSIEVGTLSVLVEYGQELDRSAVRPDGVGRHGRELRRLTRFDEDSAGRPGAVVPCPRARGPVAARVDLEIGPRCRCRDARLHDSDPVGCSDKGRPGTRET